MEKCINNLYDEVKLWNNFRIGDEHAFELIYDKYFSLLYSYGLQINSNKPLVKDCIQNLFIELWNRKSHLSEVKSIKIYLYTSLRRKIIKDVNKELKVAAKELSEKNDFEICLPHEYIIISDQLTQEIKAKLSKSFELLSKRQKEAIFLKFYDNLSYDEIAILMKLKEPKYARTLIYRAIDVLRTTLSKELFY